MFHQTAARRALPALPIIGALLAKKAATGYALFDAVHAYGVPNLYRRVARSVRAWGAPAAEQRKFLDLVKGATRAPTSAVAFIEESYLARVVARVVRNPELRRELDARARDQRRSNRMRSKRVGE